MISRFLKSLGYAVKGVAYGIRNERNIRIDMVAMVFAAALGFVARVDRGEWTAMVICMFLVPSLELVNTAIERRVTRPDMEHYDLAGIAKDTAAGAVLVSSVASLIVAGLIFLEGEKLGRITDFFFGSLSGVMLLAGFILLSYVFVTMDRFIKDNKESKDK